jgi:hypothetical protein
MIEQSKNSTTNSKNKGKKKVEGGVQLFVGGVPPSTKRSKQKNFGIFPYKF